MAVVRLIFRPCVGNHPIAPERMSFRFAARNLKINRARPVNGPMASIGPYK